AAEERRRLLVSQGKTIAYLDDPVGMFEQFEIAEKYPTRRVSTQFFIVTLSGLDTLISRIQEDCKSAFKSRKIPSKAVDSHGDPPRSV
ncbi:MAG: hypothetical protein Q7U11_14035, partial [Phenylobacterium sp.]|nr:hypothetical protein [Phenylobacterium sp.]